jgi:hypothetical protein
LIRSVLFDFEWDRIKRGLIPLLKRFRPDHPMLRIASFTVESMVSAEALLILKKFYEQNMPSLETIVVPPYYDGDITYIDTWYEDTEEYDDISTPWTFLAPRSPVQIEDIDYHNENATPNGLGFDDPAHQAHVLEQTGDFQLKITLKRARTKTDNDAGYHAEKLDVLVHAMAPAGLVRSITAPVNGYSVRGFSIIANHRKWGERKRSVGPIMAGMQWQNTLVLEELRFFFTDCMQYGNNMASRDVAERPTDFSSGSLRLLQLHDCDGSREFMDGLRSGPVNIETLLFSVLERQLTRQEEEALVHLVRSAHSLSELSLTYILPPYVSPPPPKPPSSHWTKVDDYWHEIDEVHDDQSSGRSEHTTHAQAADADEDVVAGPCRFALVQLLHETLRSLSLIQGLRDWLSESDLHLIGEKCPWLTDLAITFPAIRRGHVRRR